MQGDDKAVLTPAQGLEQESPKPLPLFVTLTLSHHSSPAPNTGILSHLGLWWLRCWRLLAG